jgi:hypothetical protein
MRYVGEAFDLGTDLSSLIVAHEGTEPKGAKEQ